MWVFAVVALAVIGIAFLTWTLRYAGPLRLARARRTIEAEVFDPSIARRVRTCYPHLSAAGIATVLAGLRDYFVCCALAPGRLVSMPSQAVDEAWHAFILSTAAYSDFCQRAFGRYLHHTPAEAMASPTAGSIGLRRAWRLACREEGIDPRQPERLPRLFAIDAALAIPDGFHYVTACGDAHRESAAATGLTAATAAAATLAIFCGSHLGQGKPGPAGGCSGGAGCGGAAGTSAGCGGGCGGGGCGGGCGGGGC